MGGSIEKGAGVSELTTIYGPLVVPDAPEDLIVRHLSAFGEWAWLEAAFCGQFVDAAAVVYDVGACLGTYSLGVAPCGPAKIVAVEANPDLIPLLTENLRRNCAGVAHVVVNAAVGLAGETQGATFAVAPGNIGASQVTHDPERGSGVRLRPLHALRREHGDYGLLKLDIEGMELEAFRSDAVWIRDNKPVIWLECNETPSTQPLFGALKWAGYDIFYFAFPAFRKGNFNANPEPVFPCAYEAALLGIAPGAAPELSREARENDCLLVPVPEYSALKAAMWRTPRWARPEWANLTRPELIALLGRAERGQKLASFLSA